MKSFFRTYGQKLTWHICHAFAFLLLVLVLLERFVPGAVLGHGPLFLAIPLFVVCITFHPASQTPTRPWLLADLWFIVALCLGRIVMQLSAGNSLAWVLGGCASVLVMAFLWIFSHPSEHSER